MSMKRVVYYNETHKKRYFAEQNLLHDEIFFIYYDIVLNHFSKKIATIAAIKEIFHIRTHKSRRKTKNLAAAFNNSIHDNNLKVLL